MKRTDTLSKSLSLLLDDAMSFDHVVTHVREAFKEEGFGVLTEMDVQQTLRDKIEVTMEPYTVLGMCNPVLASRAIAIEPKIGLLLPCNVLVAGVNGKTEVTVQDPLLMVTITGNEALQTIAEEARTKIDSALARLKVHP